MVNNEENLLLLDDEHSQRLCVCCREISKIYEEIWRGTIKEAVEWVNNMIEKNDSNTTNSGASEGRIRGEYTIILGPWIKKGITKGEVEERILNMLEKLNQDGVRRSEAISIICEDQEVKEVWGVRKSEIYKLSYSLDWD